MGRGPLLLLLSLALNRTRVIARSSARSDASLLPRHSTMIFRLLGPPQEDTDIVELRLGAQHCRHPYIRTCLGGQRQRNAPSCPDILAGTRLSTESTATVPSHKSNRRAPAQREIHLGVVGGDDVKCQPAPAPRGCIGFVTSVTPAIRDGGGGCHNMAGLQQHTYRHGQESGSPCHCADSRCLLRPPFPEAQRAKGQRVDAAETSSSGTAAGYNRAYTPPRVSSAVWVSSSAIRLRSTTTSRSARRTVPAGAPR